jgi:RNA polymerase sigma factor (sigma-70 family)
VEEQPNKGLRARVIWVVSERGTSVVAIGEVYRTRGAAFLRLALARTGDLDRAHDALHEGFARAIKSRGSFCGQGSLEAWIARCVINAAHDARQFPKHDVHRDRIGDEPALAERMIAREAVAQLPQRQRDALFLRHYLELSYAEIAEAMELGVGTVSATLHAARAALAEALREAV